MSSTTTQNGWLIFAAALIISTPYTLVSKQLLSMQGIDAQGHIAQFHFPIFQSCGKFIGMALTLVMHFAVINFHIPFPGYIHTAAENVSLLGAPTGAANKNASHAEVIPKPLVPATESSPNNGGIDHSGSDDSQDSRLPPNDREGSMKLLTNALRLSAMLFLPSLCDLVGTILVTAGMQYLSASMSQMLRGSSLIYVTIAKHFILHSRLRGYQWIGVAFVMAAVAVLGFVADSHDKQHGPESRTSLGVLLTLSGAFACGVQFVIEDKLLHLDEPVSPLILIGIEGIWGTAICLAVCFPLGLEDLGAAWTIFSSSAYIQIVFAFFLLTCTAFNVLSALVSMLLDSVWRTILGNFRPVAVWLSALSIHYLCSPGLFEAWDAYSKYQVLSLLVLLYGTSIYSAFLPLEGKWSTFFLDCSDEYNPLSDAEMQPLLPDSRPRRESMWAADKMRELVKHGGAFYVNPEATRRWKKVRNVVRLMGAMKKFQHVDAVKT